MVIQYKCPNCGADMAFDAKSGNLSCGSCGTTLDIKAYQQQDENYKAEDSKEDINETFGEYEEVHEEVNEKTYAENEAVEYQCENCGASLVADADTTAAKCSFCGSPMILSDRLTGKKAPTKVIPFTITKEEAQEAFKKWCKKGLVTPKDFMNADRIKEIVGIYIPFWLFDTNGQGYAVANCTKVRSYTSGDYNITETRHYEVYRDVDLNYNLLPADASEKMDDVMMDKIEPFHYDGLNDFSAMYLPGYVAESYNYTDAELFPRIQERIQEYMDSYIKGTITGYSSTSIRERNYNIRKRRADYTLMPIWMICYDYKNTKHNFYMNGQTGKIVGKPPISKGKVAAWFGGVSAASFVILRLLSLLIGGIS